MRKNSLSTVVTVFVVLGCIYIFTLIANPFAYFHNHADCIKAITKAEVLEKHLENADLSSPVPLTTNWNEFRRKQALLQWDKAARMSVREAQLVSPKTIHQLFPITYECDRNALKKIGGEPGNGNDGAKWICGEYSDFDDNKCVVVSLGSRGDWSFEMSVIKESNNRCKLYTFDCTGTWKAPHPNIHFESWCLAGKDYTEEGRIYKKWDTIVKDLGLTHVSFLKMDIEGFEWNTLPHMLEHPEQSLLPEQISFEIHLWGSQPPDNTPSNMRFEGTDYLHGTIELFKLIDKAGYHVASYEYNPQSIAECCAEYVLVKPPKSIQ